MDLVRLAIVYDTSQAAARLQELDQKLNTLQTTTGGATHGFGQLQRGLQSFAFQAAGIPGPIGQISTGLLQFASGHALVVGVVAGIGLIASAWRLATKEARDFAKSIEDSQKLAAQLVTSSHFTAIQQQIQAQNAVIEARERLIKIATPQQIPGQPFVSQPDAANVIRAQAALTAAQHALDLANANVAASVKAAADALDKKLHPALTAQESAALDVAAGFKEIQRTIAELLPDLSSFLATIQLGIPGTKDVTFQVDVSKQFYEGLRRQIDTQNTLDKVYNSTKASTERMRQSFDLAGKSVLDFIGALAQVIGVLFPNSPGLGYAVLGIGQAIIGGRQGGGGGGREAKPIKGNVSSEPSMTTNVNYNVMTNDAQGVAQWAERHGPVIAAEIVRQADRSRAIRRRFWRG